MNAKNLPLKFGFVLVLVAVCLYSLFFGNKIRLGIDLRGGYSLVFEIRTNQAEISRLKKDRQECQARLVEAKTDAQKKEIDATIARIDETLKGLESTQESTAGLADEMIKVLKERIDRQGLRGLEWRPLGSNRIEVRMPAGKAESRQAKEAYDAALNALEDANFRRSAITAMLEASGPDRQERIRRMAGDQKDLADKLADLAKAYDRLIAARKSGDENAITDAQADYEKQLLAIQDFNVNVQDLQGILENYVSKAEEGALGSKSEVQRRTELYQTGLDAFIKKHPTRKAAIEGGAKKYQAWAEARQYLDDPSDLKRLINKAGVLEFRICPLLPGSGQGLHLNEEEYRSYRDELATKGPEAGRRRNAPYLWFALAGDREGYGGYVTGDYGGKRYVLLYNQPGYMMLHETGPNSWSLSKAYYTNDERGAPAVGFEFDEAGAKRFAAMTSRHVGDGMAILLDDEVYSAPVIRTVISSSGQISGRFTPDQVNDLVRILKAGSLPAKLNPEPVAQSSFGPALGQENLRLALKAGYWSLIVVSAFMVGYYLLAGCIADMALYLNILLVLGAMSVLNAVFTLPGIAGVILTIGMAVDANVLIYERLREEQAKGQSIRMALKNAYARAFSAIFDSNITTLISCVILGWVGTEEIRGFAITLGLGVLFNIFTAVTVTRWVFQLMLESGLVKKHFSMLRLIGVPSINWMSKRYYFWAFSLATGILGVASLFWQGKNIWGIEFSAGTQAVLKFKDDALINGQLPNDGLVRQKFIDQAAKDGQGKLTDTARVETLVQPDRVSEFLKDRGGDENGNITLAKWRAQHLNEEFFKKIDLNGDGVLSKDELSKYLPANSFQVASTDTDLEHTRKVAVEAFGSALQIRTASTFDFARGGRSQAMGVDIDPNGMTTITPSLSEKAKPTFRPDLEDYDGGVLLVAENVNPSMTRTDLVQRIREMRFQPDFAGLLTHQTEVIGLAGTGGVPSAQAAAAPSGGNGGEAEKYSSFAILVRASEADLSQGENAWETFAAKERDLIKQAFAREDVMTAINFDPAIASEAKNGAIVALILAWLAMIAYLWFRFGQARWGLAAVICLIHDAVIIVGLVAVSDWLSRLAFAQWLGIGSFKIDLAMVAAILTIIGYSVNDTIVVFDRIRENRGKLAAVNARIINVSINQTLSRTLLTSSATLIVVVIMYIWGGPGMHPFNFALLVGICFGTYSSIAVAAPILLGFKQMVIGHLGGPEAVPVPAPAETKAPAQAEVQASRKVGP